MEITICDLQNRYGGIKDRFPPDFLVQLTRKELEEVRRSRSQNVTLKRGSNIKYLPFAFTEHGVIMAATVLNSPQAVQMSRLPLRSSAYSFTQ